MVTSEAYYNNFITVFVDAVDLAETIISAGLNYRLYFCPSLCELIFRKVVGNGA